MKRYDVCIVGAGVAGASMAAYLGAKGIKVAIIERFLNERDVIVGELLQPGGVKMLKDMGLGMFLDNMDAQAVFGYNVILEKYDTLIPYPSKYEESGFGFRNGKFVQNMREHIKNLGSVDVIEGKAIAIIEKDGEVQGVRLQRKNSSEEEELYSSLTIIADGPLSKFREHLSKPTVIKSGTFLGVILEDAELPHPNHGHLVIGNHPPFVLYPVNSTEIRILIDFPGDEPPRGKQELQSILHDLFFEPMPDQLKPAFKIAIEKASFKMMPNHRLAAEPIHKNGAVLLGDSLNMRHPLTGGGMTAVFSDVKNLGDRLINLTSFQEGKALSEALKAYYTSRHEGVQTINILADALYGVVNHAGLRESFFEYVKRGGKYAGEPVSLLGGLNRDKKLLIRHFFAVANYGSKRTFSEKQGFEKLGSSYNLVRDAVEIISPLLLSEKPDAATKLLLKTLSGSSTAKKQV